VTGDLSVSVQAPECWLADALCKIIWLAGADAASLLQRHRARTWVLKTGHSYRQAHAA
jgi:thiamine biosynthesis lipoprotein ApbE